MPLYEYHCPSCDLTFEVLASLSEAQKKGPCPECGRRVPRVVSIFAIASGGSGEPNLTPRRGLKHKEETAQKAAKKPKDPRPLCLQYPHLPLLCHMDEKAAKRWVAHAHGRGPEYDDKMAMREELRKKRGETPPEPGLSQAEGQETPDHGDHSHGQAHPHNYRRHPHMHGHLHARNKSHGHARAGSRVHSH